MVEAEWEAFLTVEGTGWKRFSLRGALSPDNDGRLDASVALGAPGIRAEGESSRAVPPMEGAHRAAVAARAAGLPAVGIPRVVSEPTRRSRRTP